MRKYEDFFSLDESKQVLRDFDDKTWEHWMNMEDKERAARFVEIAKTHGFSLILNDQTYDASGRRNDCGVGIWRVPGHRADYSDVWQELRKED